MNQHWCEQTIVPRKSVTYPYFLSLLLSCTFICIFLKCNALTFTLATPGEQNDQSDESARLPPIQPQACAALLVFPLLYWLDYIVSCVCGLDKLELHGLGWGCYHGLGMLTWVGDAIMY